MPRTHSLSHMVRRSATDARLRQQRSEFAAQIRLAGTGEAANHDLGPRRECTDALTHEMPELADDPVPLHRVPHDLAHNKTRPGCGTLRTGDEMQDEVL